MSTFVNNWILINGGQNGDFDAVQAQAPRFDELVKPAGLALAVALAVWPHDFLLPRNSQVCQGTWPRATGLRFPCVTGALDPRFPVCDRRLAPRFAPPAPGPAVSVESK